MLGPEKILDEDIELSDEPSSMEITAEGYAFFEF